jgi:hypothetical protein
MPTLKMLAECEKRESNGSPNGLPSPVAELETGSELTTVQGPEVISQAPSDNVLENFHYASALRGVSDGTELNPCVYPMAREEQGQPLDAGDNSPSASLGTEPIPARESTRVPATANNATLRVGVRAAAARSQKNFLFGATIGLAELARSQLSNARFSLSSTMEHILGCLPDIGIAWNPLRISMPAGFRSKQRVLSAAAVPTGVLLILLVFLFLKTTSSQPSKAAVATSEKSAVAKLATVSVPFQGLQQHSGAVPAHQLSHMQVTDPAVSSALYSLSRYEIVGLRRRAVYGDDAAALLLGMAYETGHLVPQNCVKAGEWVTKSAHEGNAAAEYNLGLRYRQADGELANQEVGAQWLRKAAAQKYSQAQLALESVP